MTILLRGGCVLYVALRPDPPTVPPTVELLSWPQARAQALPLRMAVFVDEQGVPAEMEVNEWDAQAVHALAYDGAQAVATGRLLADGRIGRMAVRVDCRGRGFGAAVLRALIEHARAQGLGAVFLHAQTHAMDFYRRYGFVETGAPFMEAGIAHRAMRRNL